MPSRRQFLASASSALGVGSLAGCLSELRFAETGHLQLKAVSLAWDHDGQRFRSEPLDVRFDGRDRLVSGEYDPAFVGDSVRVPDDVVVSDEAHDRLARRFDVTYLLGICGSDFAASDESYGCRNTATSRADFNRVQSNDRAEVRLADRRFDVIDVYEDAYEIAEADLRTFDFAERHADDGIRPEEW
ncbi:hypothetical protein [Halorussus salinisoli]|uniref:hypothetical protein n=1 Tax=Halorussus salinisoli TaxID=2558242 RepID=UPI0010C1F352|nr:hypothetical protein [Halorussus salinisoli]